MPSILRNIWAVSHRGRWGVVITGLLLAAALLGPLLTLHDPNAIDTAAAFEPASAAHPLGTDSLGRDVLARLLYGSRLSLSIAAGAVMVAALIGHVFGMAAGYLGGATDVAVGRVTDMFFAIPDLIIAIGIIAILGPSPLNTALAVGLAFAPLYVRIVRSAVIQAKAQDFVTHARALGIPWWRILPKEIWPVALPTLLVQSTMMLGFAILNEAGLGFIGLGVQPPTASWGAMLTDGRRFILSEPLLVLSVGTALAIAVFGLNLLSDGLKDALDPRVAPVRRRAWRREQR